MSENKFVELLNIKKDRCARFDRLDAVLVVCPDMGGRTFAQVCGIAPHRMDMDSIRNPNQPFNNFGGGNFWPAPEGGKFGFNYKGDEWGVQEAINNQPFEIVSSGEDSVVMEKRVAITNRAGTVMDARMRREVVVTDSVPSALEGQRVKGMLSYQAIDSFEVLNEVSTEDGLIAAWTLEQFDATKDTVAFCIVENPREAINFDFYDHPGDRISYFSNGFTYKTDGLKAGQIGIKQSAAASLIGFYDAARGIVCIRENRGPSGGVFFNIADNDQPDGPYSAADNYSIFNSDPEMGAFELETIGSAIVENGVLKGSNLVSVTTFAVFQQPTDAEAFAMSLIGG